MLFKEAGQYRMGMSLKNPDPQLQTIINQGSNCARQSLWHHITTYAANDRLVLSPVGTFQYFLLILSVDPGLSTHKET